MLLNNRSEIIVGRDRSAVKHLIKTYKCLEVISVSAFFDKVRLLPFLFEKGLRRDDEAPFIFAKEILIGHKKFPLTYADKFKTLFSSILHGEILPSELNKFIKNQEELFSIIEILCHIEKRMREHQLVNGVWALFNANKIMYQKEIIPLALQSTQKIHLCYLVDLTSLEISVIKTLARLGLNIKLTLPYDFYERGINSAVDFIAKQFEKESELTNFEIIFESLVKKQPTNPIIKNLFVSDKKIPVKNQNVTLYEANNLEDEGHEIANKIANIKTLKPYSHIALAVGSLDKRTDIIKASLTSMGISIKDRKGIPLNDTIAGKLLTNIFEARLNHMPKSILLSMLCNPHSAFYIEDKNIFYKVHELLKELGIDDSLPLSKNYDRFNHRLSRYLAYCSMPDERQTALYLTEILQTINSELSSLKERDTFLNHVRSLISIIPNCFSETTNDLGLTQIVSALKSLEKSASYNEQEKEIGLRDFINLLRNFIRKHTVSPIDHDNEVAVEILLLPELLGREFDCVFIADLAFGRIPKNPSKELLLNDEQRIKINKAAKKNVLRVFFEDPFEPMPVPPRQALEPFWFAGAIACARNYIHFSYAKKNENNEEQAPSDFYLWLKNNLIIHNEPINHLSKKFITKQDIRFKEGQNAKREKVKDDRIIAINERKDAFSCKKHADYAFNFNSTDLMNLFKGRLDDKPKRAITPTFAEKFVECKFFGLFDLLVDIDHIKKDRDEPDARIIGQIAHRCLEIYFSRFKQPLKKDEHNKELKKIIEEVCKEYLSNNFVSNIYVFYCYIEWLFYALSRLIMNFDSRSTPIAFELGFGVNKAKYPPVKIRKNNNTYLLGGVIDRIDVKNNAYLVIDYKLSASTTLKTMGNKNNFLSTNLQFPIYLRLIHSIYNNAHNLEFFYASIRDANLLLIFDQKNQEEYFLRIIDDERHDSLASIIDSIFTPLKNGKAIATPNDSCNQCDFSFICRKNEINYEA